MKTEIKRGDYVVLNDDAYILGNRENDKKNGLPIVGGCTGIVTNVALELSGIFSVDVIIPGVTDIDFSYDSSMFTKITRKEGRKNVAKFMIKHNFNTLILKFFRLDFLIKYRSNKLKGGKA